MTTEQRTYKHRVTITAACLLAALVISQHVQAQECCGSKSSTADTASAAECHSSQPAVAQRTGPAWVPPHGGQIHKSTWNIFEVLYGPQESRIYVYDIFHHPIAVRGIQGQAFMHVHSTDGKYRYPLHYMGAGDERDYLAFHVDLTRVRDGDMDVHLEFANMPNPEEPVVRFAQVFALNPSVRPALYSTAHERQSQSVFQKPPARPPAVTLADATTMDQPAIDRQKNCPVLGTALGEHGKPIKLSVNGHSLFVCCRGCIEKVLQQPDAYFQKVASVGGPSM